MDHDRRDLLSTPVPRWAILLGVLVLIATGIFVVVVVKPGSGGSTPVSTRSALSVTIPPSGIPGVTPRTAPDYTTLVLSGSALKNLNLPDVQPWSLGGDVPEGQVATVGDIVLCASGRPGSVRITSVAALRASHPLQVVRFSTRTVGAELLGFNLGPLEASGFPPGEAEVAPCRGSYQQALIGVHNVATTELGVEFRMTSALREQDKGLVLTYQGSDGTPRTLEVPVNVSFCPSARSCR